VPLFAGTCLKETSISNRFVVLKHIRDVCGFTNMTLAVSILGVTKVRSKQGLNKTPKLTWVTAENSQLKALRGTDL